MTKSLHKETRKGQGEEASIWNLISWQTEKSYYIQRDFRKKFLRITKKNISIIKTVTDNKTFWRPTLLLFQMKLQKLIKIILNEDGKTVSEK